MTSMEAEEFIMTLLGSGGPTNISEVMERYEGKTLMEAYRDFFFEIDPFGEHLDEILAYKGPRIKHTKRKTRQKITCYNYAIKEK